MKNDLRNSKNYPICKKHPEQSFALSGVHCWECDLFSSPAARAQNSVWAAGFSLEQIDAQTGYLPSHWPYHQRLELIQLIKGICCWNSKQTSDRNSGLQWRLLLPDNSIGRWCCPERGLARGEVDSPPDSSAKERERTELEGVLPVFEPTHLVISDWERLFLTMPCCHRMFLGDVTLLHMCKISKVGFGNSCIPETRGFLWVVREWLVVPNLAVDVGNAMGTISKIHVLKHWNSPPGGNAAMKLMSRKEGLRRKFLQQIRSTYWSR